MMQLLRSCGVKDKDKDKEKEKEKNKKDPLAKLKKCGVKNWCEAAVTKLEVLEGKGKKSKYWTPKLAKELTGYKDSLRQQVKLLTKIYQQRKPETPKVKEQCQEALKDLKTSNTFMNQNNKILEKRETLCLQLLVGVPNRLAAMFLIGRQRFASILLPKQVRQILKANMKKSYSS